MLYIPPYSILCKWMDRYAQPDASRLIAPYDDVLDVLKGFLAPIPVDDTWYLTEYPAVADYLRRSPNETPGLHFCKHGYFEGRRPFAPNSNGLTEPVPFNHLKTGLRVTPAHGRLRVDVDRTAFLDIIKSLLIAVPVSQAWYRSTYPAAARLVDDGTFRSETDYYAQRGYFEGHFAFDIVVDEDWYVARYEHVRTGLKRGHAKSAQDHFVRLGYQEGCRPAPP